MKRCLLKLMFGLSLCAVLIGCQKKKEDEAPVRQEVHQEQVKEEQSEQEMKEENPVNPYFVFQDDQEDTLAAMKFCGYGNEEKEEGFQKFLDEYQLDEELFDVVIDVDDAEWFVIIPKYEGTEIKVEQVQLQDDGELQAVDCLTTTKQPVLLGCNYSDIVPSTKVTITYQNEMIEFNPFISLENGQITEEDRVITNIRRD